MRRFRRTIFGSCEGGIEENKFNSIIVRAINFTKKEKRPQNPKNNKMTQSIQTVLLIVLPDLTNVDGAAKTTSTLCR